MAARKKIKIIGGGFAGVKCALTLRKKLKRDEADIILYNSENYMVFQPLLAEVVGASISPEPVAVPLRQMLPGVWPGVCSIEKCRSPMSMVSPSLSSLSGGLGVL